MYDTTKPNTDLSLSQRQRTWDCCKFIKIIDAPTPIIKRNFPIDVFEIDHTDGIGTKGKIHWKARTFKNAVIDALAMNINDLTMSHAEPFKLQNHIIMPVDDREAVEEIMTALADECLQRKIVITGGETSIDDERDSIEISITMSGWMTNYYPNKFRKGAKLVGLASSGLHSNGFTLVRKLLEFDPEWTTPTVIYNLPLAPFSIVGIQHITGGGFSKLRSKLDPNANIYIHKSHELQPQKIFQDIYSLVKDDVKMYKTFNCGIGMVLAVVPDMLEWVVERVGGTVIGEVIEGKGEILIESMFSKEIVKL